MINKVLGQEIQDLEERKRFLLDNSDEVVVMDYHKMFNSDELTKKKTLLSEICIKINDIEEAKKAAMESFKEEMKPLKDERQELLKDIKSKGQLVSEKCYKFIEQDDKMACFSNAEGILVSSPPATKDELQPTIFTLIRAQAQ